MGNKDGMVFEKIINKAMAGFAKLRSSAFRHWFDWRCRNVLQAPPASINKDGAFVVLTMTCHRDLIQYLVAIKSFTRNAMPRKVYVLNDGSLTAKDKGILESHVPGIEFLSLDTFASDVCPRGGCWERLLAVAELAEQDYVVQLDADTLTTGSVDEVLDCIGAEACFVLSTNAKFRDFQPMQQRYETAKSEFDRGVGSTHVQFMTELNLNKLKNYQDMKYIRGCAGFSGFAKGSISRELIEDLSSQLSSAVGDKWREWGSEQVMSNIVIANAEKATVLPHPAYSNCYESDEEKTRFFHYIGICRFTDGQYARKASDAIKALIRSA